MSNSPELRQDIVSGDWILVAPGRRYRPHNFALKSKSRAVPKSHCPFENPQKSGNEVPLLWYSKKGKESGNLRRDWVLQVIQNKYPIMSEQRGVCPTPIRYGVYRRMKGGGFHEVVVFRSHTKFLGDMTAREADHVISAYQERILFHEREKCLRYVFIFHNHGDAAGASIFHPHSQIMALPIIPPDIYRSLRGAERYRQKHGACVHCKVIGWELKKRERVIYKNKAFVVIAPFASHVNFEVRIFPRAHSASFQKLSRGERLLLADVLTVTLRRLKKVLQNPAYNFYIHTAPVGDGKFSYYHWHLEILPKTSHLAGVELGTGIEVITMPPEDAAAYLRKAH
jgi:UDPglucose--hexose-1-phosphate uridylyltransferase